MNSLAVRKEKAAAGMFLRSEQTPATAKQPNKTTSSSLFPSDETRFYT